jgi:iron uptake system component EfeO
MKKLVLLCCLAACGDDSRSDAQFASDVAGSMHDSLQGDLADLVQAAKDLQTAAPTPAGRGWDATADAAAITAMKAAWRRSRVAYEHIEGALAPIFPDIDVAIDARYDDFLAGLGATGDADLFDDEGVTGMHAVERILYSDQIRPEVIEFESTLPGYRPARFPQTAAEALEMKTKLLQKLIDDTTALKTQWTPAKVDIEAAFDGLVSLMNEQHEKVNKAATGEEESRYADMTLFDLRNNLAGTQKVYVLFQDWLHARSGGMDIDAHITGGMATLSTLYGTYTGDAVPEPPPTWSSDDPTPADQQTPFGKLFVGVEDAVDPNRPGSVVAEMNQAATLLGFQPFSE